MRSVVLPWFHVGSIWVLSFFGCPCVFWPLIVLGRFWPEKNKAGFKTGVERLENNLWIEA